MEELKPCPFCGSNNQTIKNVWQTWRFVACECKAGGAPAKDDEGAIRNWNIRQERTCHIEEAEFEFIGSDDHKKGTARYYVCSECQDMIEQDANYCPNCGAKVVNDA